MSEETAKNIDTNTGLAAGALWIIFFLGAVGVAVVGVQIDDAETAVVALEREQASTRQATQELVKAIALGFAQARKPPPAALACGACVCPPVAESPAP